MQPTDDADARSRWLAELLDSHGGPLALYAAQWTSAADDCVQEALVELAGQATLPTNAVAWLYRVVRYRALNHARSEQRRQRNERAAWLARLETSANAQERRELLDAVAALPDAQREIVLLKIWGGLTFAEIAAVVGQSSSTLQRRYTEALVGLRKQWDTTCPQMTKSE